MASYLPHQLATSGESQPARALANAIKEAAQDVPVPDIAKELVIRTGKNAGKNPSMTSVHRALADAEEADSEQPGQVVTRCVRIGPRVVQAAP